MLGWEKLNCKWWIAEGLVWTTQRVKAYSGSFTSRSPTKSSQWISEKMLLAGKKKSNQIHPSILLCFYYYYWSIIASQYCVTFCRTKKWISGSFPPPSPTSHPSRSSQSTKFCFLCFIAGSHQLYVLHMVTYIRQSWSSYSSHPLLPPVPTRLFSMSASLFLPWK